LLDTATLTWTEVGSGFGIPRWNHCACSVEAIPHWKVFIFGGSSGDLVQSGVAGGVQGAFQQVRAARPLV
jgi:dynein heavy chain